MSYSDAWVGRMWKKKKKKAADAEMAGQEYSHLTVMRTRVRGATHNGWHINAEVREWVHPYWSIDWKKLARCPNRESNCMINQNMVCQQFPSLAFPALSYWQLLCHWLPYSLVNLREVFFFMGGLVWMLNFKTRIKHHSPDSILLITMSKSHQVSGRQQTMNRNHQCFVPPKV